MKLILQMDSNVKSYDTSYIQKKKPQIKCSSCTNTKKSSNHKKVLYSVKCVKTVSHVRGPKAKLDKTLLPEQQNTGDIVFDKVPFLATILNNFTSCLQERKLNKYLSSWSQDIIFPYTKNMTYSHWFCYGNNSFPRFDSLLTKENSNSTILRRKFSYGKLYKISRRNLNNHCSYSGNLNRKIAQYRSSKHKVPLCKRCQPKPKKIPFWRKWYYALFGEQKETNQTEECETQCFCLNPEKKKEKSEGKSNDSLGSTKMKKEKCMDVTVIDKPLQVHVNEQSFSESKPLCKKVCATDDSDLLSCSNIFRQRKKEQSKPKVKKCINKCKVKSSNSSVAKQSSKNLTTKSSTDCKQRKLMKKQKCSHSDFSDWKTICSKSEVEAQTSRNCISKSSTDCKQRKLMKEQKSSHSNFSDSKTSCSKSTPTKSDDHLLLTCRNLREMLGFGIPCVDKIPNKCDEHKICKIKDHKENKTNDNFDDDDDDDYDNEDEECKHKTQRFQCKGKVGNYDETGLLSCRNIKKSSKKIPCIEQSYSSLISQMPKTPFDKPIPCIEQSYSSLISQMPKTPFDKPIPCIKKIMDISDPIPCIKLTLDHPPCKNQNKNRRCTPCNRPRRTDEHCNKYRRCVPCKSSQSTGQLKYKRCVPCKPLRCTVGHKNKQCVPCKTTNPKLYSSKQELMPNITESSASSAFRLMMSHVKNKKNCAVNETILLNLPKEFKMFSAESPESSINKCADIYNNNNFNGENVIFSPSIYEQYPFNHSDSETFRINPTNHFTISKKTSQAINKRILENINIKDVKVKRVLSSKGRNGIRLKLQLQFPETNVKKNRQKFGPL